MRIWNENAKQFLLLKIQRIYVYQIDLRSFSSNFIFQVKFQFWFRIFIIFRIFLNKSSNEANNHKKWINSKSVIASESWCRKQFLFKKNWNRDANKFLEKFASHGRFVDIWNNELIKMCNQPPHTMWKAIYWRFFGKLSMSFRICRMGLIWFDLVICILKMHSHFQSELITLILTQDVRNNL